MGQLNSLVTVNATGLIRTFSFVSRKVHCGDSIVIDNPWLEVFVNINGITWGSNGIARLRCETTDCIPIDYVVMDPNIISRWRPYQIYAGIRHCGLKVGYLRWGHRITG